MTLYLFIGKLSLFAEYEVKKRKQCMLLKVFKVLLHSSTYCSILKVLLCSTQRTAAPRYCYIQSTGVFWIIYGGMLRALWFTIYAWFTSSKGKYLWLIKDWFWITHTEGYLIHTQRKKFIVLKVFKRLVFGSYGLIDYE